MSAASTLAIEASGLEKSFRASARSAASISRYVFAPLTTYLYGRK